MSKISNFGSVPVIGGFKRQGNFALTEANAVAIDEQDTRLDVFIDEVTDAFRNYSRPTYGGLEDKPKINGVSLAGDISSADLNINYSDIAGVPTFTTNEGNVVTAVQGKSAYQIAIETGKIDSTTTEAQWLDSLKGKSAYQVGKEAGAIPTEMTESEWISSLKGDSGIAVAGSNDHIHLLQVSSMSDMQGLLQNLDFGKFRDGDIVFVAMDMGESLGDLFGSIFEGLLGSIFGSE